ncbi:hypothetical protein BKM19_001775 [Pseudomonas amygdali pv. morsprunorum]|nr:hypothetical protein BKM19_001775 [Pseudomonas amygdali pv. morsprunorum]POP87007.1 hypothetical protein CXB39_29545 [Pseudomonas amygdali pv. morsprunorum]
MGVRLKRLKMVSTYIWVDTIASSDGVRKVCCPDGYRCRFPQRVVPPRKDSNEPFRFMPETDT